MKTRHGSLESSILNALWGLEKDGIFTKSVKDVYEILAKNEDEKRAYTTLKTVMDRLTEKKVLMRFKQGKKFFYRTAYSNDEMIVNSLNLIAERYCNGNFDRLSAIIDEIKQKEYITA